MDCVTPPKVKKAVKKCAGTHNGALTRLQGCYVHVFHKKPVCSKRFSVQASGYSPILYYSCLFWLQYRLYVLLYLLFSYTKRDTRVERNKQANQCRLMTLSGFCEHSGDHNEGILVLPIMPHPYGATRTGFSLCCGF